MAPVRMLYLRRLPIAVAAGCRSMGADPLSSAATDFRSEQQLDRLGEEYRRLRRSFAYHPHVRIVSARNDPPVEFEIEFRVRSLCVNEAGQLAYCDTVSMQVA